MPQPVDALIADLLARPVTAADLRQDAAHAQGLSAADAERVRAHLLASFEARGMPADVAPVVAEELRTSQSPVVLAGAARAVRGDRGGDWAELLQGAADRIATSDVFVRWQPGVVAPSWMRTARGELLATIDELHAAREAPSIGIPTPSFEVDAAALRAIAVEDQDGRASTLADLIEGETVLAFFYTRCMNPARCSLTITRLAALAGGDRAVVAMSYDPAFDSPARLRRYGADRGFAFGERARLVRTVDAWPAVRELFGLRVGYGPSTVNEHARELFLVRRAGEGVVVQGLDPDAIADVATLDRYFVASE
ncbi:SCO family protein [Microbacterium sp. B2969]|uniref:SCO family protein n=1 Tax=Microbacterium alkaliflavum TaxID=3248839 RepID=A0ABW7QG33_9MICO